jgi:hypothetical protein
MSSFQYSFRGDYRVQRHGSLWFAGEASEFCRKPQWAIKRRWRRFAAAVGSSWHLMAGHGAKIQRKQEEAVAALLSQRSVEDTARVAGIGTRTLLRWMKLPEFQTAYREARRAAFGQSIARLQQATGMAVSVLLKVMVDSATPASVKVRAADSVLDHSAKAIEIEDIEARLSELERAAEASKSDRKG